MEAVPHIRVAGDALEVDGRPGFLFGGEMQYFRIRDRDHDGERTARIWSERLEQLRATGANLVTTYIPWDYHAPAPGRLDFEGSRDVRRFLEIAAEKGFHLIVKPGPNITAEWPYGFGSWGAIPLWWRRRNPDELVLDRAGGVFRWHPFLPALGRGRNTLPSLASEAFRKATEAWYAAVLEEIRPLLGPGQPVIGVQLDNETNLFWQDAYWIDFHPAALARYRARLRERYGEIGALSEAYRRTYRSFDEVRPPRKGRGTRARHRDWFDHQHALCGEWIEDCRAIFSRLGVNEPDVLFLTNDTHQVFALRDLVLPEGPSKNRCALHALDSYPRCLPIPRSPRVLFDRPYEPDFTNKLIDVYNDLYAGPSRFTFGIEIQGGHFAVPVFGVPLTPHKVSPETTLQTYLRLIAHGMKALAVYVACGGLNLDGTSYDFQAAIRLDGSLHPRYEGLRSLGRFIRAHERALLSASAVESRVAILANARCLGPGYGPEGEQRIAGDELRATFGWLANAGFTPRVLDIELAEDRDLEGIRSLVFPTSGHFGEPVARKLERFVERGGTLIQAISPGPLARSLFPARPARRGVRLGALLSGGAARFEVSGARGRLALPLGSRRVRLPPSAERILSFPGEGDDVLGYARATGRGRAIFLTALPVDLFSDARYFTSPAPPLEARALFARRLLRAAGERPLFGLGSVREECHARSVPGGPVFLFLFSGHEERETCVRLLDLDALGLEADRRYSVEDVFGAETPARLGERTGAALRDEGIAVHLESRGAAVLAVRSVAAP